MKFFPKLKNLSKSELYDYYHINFLIDDNFDNLPVITFIVEEGDKQSYVKSVDALGISGSELVKHAFSTLKNAQLPWNVMDRVVVIEEQDLASEKILDKDFLVTISDKLKASKIAVSIPQNHLFLCCDASDEEAMKKLHQRASECYSNFGKSPLSNLIFMVNQEGIIEEQYENKIKIKANVIDFKYPVGYSEKIDDLFLFGSLYAVRISCEALDGEVLQKGLQMSIGNVLVEHLKKEDFTGTIEIHTAAGFPFKDEQSMRYVNSLFEQLKNNTQLTQSIASSGKKVEISLLFGEDFQKGDVHKKIKINL